MNSAALRSLNEIIVNDGVAAGLLKVEKDLTFFGRETRPIYRMLATTTNPFIPGLSGEEDKALTFLDKLGIPLKQGDKPRALCDLTDEERKRLCSALADHLLSKGLHLEVENLIGYIYVLNQRRTQHCTSRRARIRCLVELDRTHGPTEPRHSYLHGRPQSGAGRGKQNSRGLPQEHQQVPRLGLGKA